MEGEGLPLGLLQLMRGVESVSGEIELSVELLTS